MRVRDGMGAGVLTVGPDHTLRQVAVMMTQRNVGAAVVLDIDGEGPGIITERDLMHALAVGEDPDRQRVRDHLTQQAFVVTGDAHLHAAAEAMVKGGFRHLIVVDEWSSDPVGMLSIRDIVRCWMQDGVLPPDTSDD